MEIDFSAIIGLVGVILGFLLSEAGEWFRNYRRKRRLIGVISYELIQNKQIIQTGEKTNDKVKLQGAFITNSYDTLSLELALYLKPSTLTSLHETYIEIKNLNDPKFYLQQNNYRIYSSRHIGKLLGDIEKVLNLLNQDS